MSHLNMGKGNTGRYPKLNGNSHQRRKQKRIKIYPDLKKALQEAIQYEKENS